MSINFGEVIRDYLKIIPSPTKIKGKLHELKLSLSEFKIPLRCRVNSVNHEMMIGKLNQIRKFSQNSQFQSKTPKKIEEKGSKKRLELKEKLISLVRLPAKPIRLQRISIPSVVYKKSISKCFEKSQIRSSLKNSNPSSNLNPTKHRFTQSTCINTSISGWEIDSIN